MTNTENNEAVKEATYNALVELESARGECEKARLARDWTAMGLALDRLARAVAETTEAASY